MSSKFKRQYWIFASIAILSLLVGFYSFSAFQYRSELNRGFPFLPSGSYVGEIDFNLGSGSRTKTFYVERLRDGDTLLLVIFEANYQPQTLFPNRIVRFGNVESYRPLTVRYLEQELKLAGIAEDEEYFGSVRVSNEEIGNWRLRKIRPDEMMTVTSGVEEKGLSALLRSKENGRIEESRFNETKRETEEIREKILVMESSMKDESTMRLKAEERRAELMTQLNKVKGEGDRSNQNLENLVSELDLIGRITKTGATVSLERKISQREARWYDVNWQSDEELEPESVTDEESGADFFKIDLAAKKTAEIKNLIAERNEELRRIKELERIRSGATQQPGSEERKEEQPSRDLWDRLFG